MIKAFRDKNPIIKDSAYISESVDVIGNVIIEDDANIWFGTTLRGDMNSIYVGSRTNIQENSVIHVDKDYETFIGESVTIGHRAVIHGCHIENNVLIGMGSIILNGAKIGKNSIVGAGSLVTQNKVFGEGLLILGNPARAVRELTEDEIKSIETSASNYVELSKEYI